jgi:hypothetical protein
LSPGATGFSKVGASLAVSSCVPKGNVLITTARPMALSSLATAGTGASGPDEAAATGADPGEDLGAADARGAEGGAADARGAEGGTAGERGAGSLGNAGADPDSPWERRGGAGGAAERTGAGGALLRAGSGALDARACGGSGGGTERVTGRGAGSGFFGEFGSSAMAGINLTRPRSARGLASGIVPEWP